MLKDVRVKVCRANNSCSAGGPCEVWSAVVKDAIHHKCTIIGRRKNGRGDERTASMHSAKQRQCKNSRTIHWGVSLDQVSGQTTFENSTKDLTTFPRNFRGRPAFWGRSGLVRLTRSRSRSGTGSPAKNEGSKRHTPGTSLWSSVLCSQEIEVVKKSSIR